MEPSCGNILWQLRFLCVSGAITILKRTQYWWFSSGWDGDIDGHVYDLWSHMIIYLLGLDWQTAAPLFDEFDSWHLSVLNECYMSLPNKPWYMSYGLPVLSSLKGELARLIDDEGIGFNYDALSSVDLADKIASLANISVYETMSFKARRLFDERFSSSSIYSRYSDTIVSLALSSVGVQWCLGL